MSKLRDIYRVLAGDLSTEAITRLIHTNNELRREIREWKGKAARAQALGEAVAKGNSRVITDMQLSIMATTPKYCAFCDRDTPHFTTGYCAWCSTK